MHKKLKAGCKVFNGLAKNKPVNLLRIFQYIFLMALPAILSVTSCSEAGSFARSIERASGKDAYLQHDIFSARIQLTFGGQERIFGNMFIETRGDRSRFEFDNGEVMLFDGKNAYASSNELISRLPRIRFEVLTWPYFLELPFKLNDPGVNLQTLGSKTMNGNLIPSARLTFSAGFGDTSEDWYILYRNPQSKLLQAAAYIVTYGQSVEDAQKEPHAIVYSKYREIGNVQIATEWNFHNWTLEDGIMGRAIGQASLSQLKFVSYNSVSFIAPGEYILATLP